MNIMDFSLITDEPLDYCVYMHKNKITGELYIGITNNVQRRWAGKVAAYESCPDFYEALQKYGWDGFDHEVLIEGISKKMAVVIECELITKYDTVNNGYNKSNGTWNYKDYFNMPIYQYDLDGTFIKKWKSESEASNYYGVYRVGYGMSSCGFQWTRAYVNKMPVYNHSQNKKFLPIFQYNIDGSFVRKWENQGDAVELYGISIKRCADNKARTAYGYRWSLEYLEKLPPLPPLKSHKKVYRIDPKQMNYDNPKYKQSPKVYKVDLDGNILGSFNNCAEIDDEDARIDLIYNTCIKKNYYAYNSILWIFEDAINDISTIIEDYKKLHPRIIQYDLDGDFIRIFNNIPDVVKSGYSSSVWSACNGKVAIVNDFQWRWEYDAPPGKLENHRSVKKRQIIQKSLDGQIINMYKNAKEAAKQFGAKSGWAVLEACHSKRESAYGYKWQFATREEYESYINSVTTD